MPSTTHHTPDDTAIAFEEFKSEVLQDLKIALISREMSLIGRKEVLTGKAKFGIFGDGKELAQIALAKAFQKGDWRSGYYRDQTWMLAPWRAHGGAIFCAAICKSRPRARHLFRQVGK
jgi:2-oxoisovalerate dehydrogenase E1 component